VRVLRFIFGRLKQDGDMVTFCSLKQHREEWKDDISQGLSLFRSGWGRWLGAAVRGGKFVIAGVLTDEEYRLGYAISLCRIEGGKRCVSRSIMFFGLISDKIIVIISNNSLFIGKT
jgi:hypothetical protein